ncbi:SCP2 sterol-binding domain-containing protein [Micromonospora sp. L32]|uniref:SCP2 sterol-binding domain-containing protein n=1 Tax=Micromonospora TaxID=1873 RepID=UPI003F88E66E
MTNPTRTFFDDLSDRGHVPWLEHEHGRLRVEIVDGDCWQLWTLVFDDGKVRVDPADSEVDAVLRADRAWFDRLVAGEEKLLPAVLRGEVRLDGSLDLVVLFGRLFPGPPGQAGPGTAGSVHGGTG